MGTPQEAVGIQREAWGDRKSESRLLYLQWWQNGFSRGLEEEGTAEDVEVCGEVGGVLHLEYLAPAPNPPTLFSHSPGNRGRMRIGGWKARHHSQCRCIHKSFERPEECLAPRASGRVIRSLWQQ